MRETEGETHAYGLMTTADVIDQGRCDFVTFWRPTADPTGHPGPGCLSQWWPAPFIGHGHTFRTAEHWMMWWKARVFADQRAADRVLAAETPVAVKQIGREVIGFDETIWTRHRVPVVVDGNRFKFDQHPALAEYLIGTGEAVLVEASPADPIWGVGLAPDNPAVQDPRQWRGRNLLGFALMRVRAELVAAASGPVGRHQIGSDEYNAALEFLFSEVRATCHPGADHCEFVVDTFFGYPQDCCIHHDLVVCVDHQRYLPCRKCYDKPATRPYTCDPDAIRAAFDHPPASAGDA